MKRRMRVCPICGQFKNCSNTLHGQRVCENDYQRATYPKRPCSRCGHHRMLRYRGEGPTRICEICYRALHPKLAPCQQCGVRAPLHAGLCRLHYNRRKRARWPRRRCPGCKRLKAIARELCVQCLEERNAARYVRDRLLELLGVDGVIRHLSLRRLYTQLTKMCAIHVRRWLRTLGPEICVYLRTVRDGASIAADDLLAFERVAGGHELRLVCERCGLAPTSRLARLELQIESISATLPRALALRLQQYWRFELRPRIELRPRLLRRTDPRLAGDQALLTVVGAFLQHLADQHFELESLSQGVIDRYLRCQPVSRGPFLRRFIGWLRRSVVVQRPLRGPQTSLCDAAGCSPEEYFALIRRALTDGSLPLDVRVALLLMMLCRQTLAQCVRLTRQSLEPRGRQLEVHFPSGSAWLLEGAAAAAVMQLAARGRWLFRSPLRYVRHRSARALARRMKEAGIAMDLRHLRSRAIRELLRDLDPSEMVRAIGLNPTTAGHWRARLTEAPRATKRRLARLRWKRSA
jgi:hypothetical protein